MKAKNFFLVLTSLSMITWSCTSESDLANSKTLSDTSLASSKSLKSSITANAQSLQTAVSSIMSTDGYKLLSANTSSSSVKMGVNSYYQPFDTVAVTYGLADVAGVWDYKAALNYRHRVPLNSFFQKSTTETSADFILRLPDSKIKHPWDLLHSTPADTLLTNNYVVDVSKYNRWFQQFAPGRYNWSYEMNSNIKVNDLAIGDLRILSTNDKTKGYNFSSTFGFSNGYTANTTYTDGDTIKSVYNISKDGQILYLEKYTGVRPTNYGSHPERYYSLIIGNVEIDRKGGPNSLDSAKVYLGGVLQTKAKVEMITVSTTSTETTIIKKSRTIQITFDDGTVTTVKELLGSTITDIDTIFTSIRQAYFATNIVDNVSYYIYTKK
ncbi:MAG: hypothetical protein WCK78_07165 [Paludibacter sp.]